MITPAEAAPDLPAGDGHLLAQVRLKEIAPATAAMEVRTIRIASITVPPRLRRLREDNIALLIESLREIGLREPISVIKGPDEGTASKFILVAGRHRLEAWRRLGYDTVPAIVHELSDDERQLWEIDENLCRAELTELERDDHLLKRMHWRCSMS